MFGIKLILLLLVLSGFLAYLGDILGRRIGRKKLTLFGLRPKYTAIFITVLTGVLITLFTLTIMTLLSQNMMDALFHLDAIKKDLKKTKKLADVQRAELFIKAQKVKDVNSKIGEEKEKLNQVQVKLNSTSAEKLKVEQTYNEVKNLFVKTQMHLSSARKMLSGLKASQHVLHGEVTGLKSRKFELETKISHLRGLGDDIFKQLVKTREELEKIQQEKAKVEFGLTQKTEGKIIFVSGELLGQVVIPQLSPRADVEKNVLGVLQTINARALDAGAKGVHEGESIAVYQEQWEKIVKALENQPEVKLVRIVAEENTVEGEPLRPKFLILSNTKIFNKGDLLVEETVQPGLDEKGVEAALLAVLQKAREKALASGLLTGPGGEVGGVTALRFYEVINVLRAIQSPAKVQVFTVEDIFVGGPLEVDLKVENPQPPKTP